MHVYLFVKQCFGLWTNVAIIHSMMRSGCRINSDYRKICIYMVKTSAYGPGNCSEQHSVDDCGEEQPVQNKTKTTVIIGLQSTDLSLQDECPF